MDTSSDQRVGIKVGHDAGVVEAAGEQILKLLQIGFDTHADQQTIQMAISAFQKATSITGSTISNCTIHSGEKVDNNYSVDFEPVDEDED